jgi:hypothetical protein
MVEDISLIKFNVGNFFAVLLNSRPFNPISTLLIKLVRALITSEPEPDKEMVDRLNWIYENTHEKVKESLAIVELAVFKNLDRGLNREIEIGDKEFNLTQLYKYLDEVSLELSEIVITIAKKYSIDIPMASLGLGGGSAKTISIGE